MVDLLVKQMVYLLVNGLNVRMLDIVLIHEMLIILMK